MIEQLFGTGDSIGNELSQWKTTDSTTYQSIRLTPEEKRSGQADLKL